MSATSLPSLPLTAPTPAPQASAPPRPENQQQSGASFNSHLQSAQQQHAPSADTQQTQAQDSDAGQGNADDPNAQTASPAGVASPASKPGDDAKAAMSDDSDAGIDVTGALVSTVLGLIDHASNDSHGDTAAPANGTAAKPAAQNATKQPAAPPPQPMPVAAMIPVPATPPTTTNAAPNNATGAGSANALSIGTATSGSASQKASIADFSADAGNTGDTATSATLNAGAQATAPDSVQALAGSFTAASHAAMPAAAAIASDSNTPSANDLSALGNLAATAPAIPTAAPSGTHTLAMDAPVGSSGFAKELGQQITWLSGQDIKQAQIRLNPQDLGPLDVKVSVEHGRVDVSFMTQHPATTAAVQQGLDQLQHMLGGQGLSLGHATVGQHAQQQFGAPQGQQGQGGAGSDNADEAADTPAAATRVAVGLVDAFA